MTQSIIFLEDVSFTYQGLPVLSRVSLSIKKGEVVSFVGRSGSGKTTLLRLIASLEKPETGKICVGAPVSYMTQHPLLLPRRTVLENLMLLYELDKSSQKSKVQWLERAVFFLNEVGLHDFSAFYPHELSGGMKSRAVLARILLEDKPILLLDEPFATLDAMTREEMQQLVLKLQKKYQKTILLVTHDILEAMKMSCQLYLIADSCIKYSWNILQDSSRHSAVADEILKLLAKKQKLAL